MDITKILAIGGKPGLYKIIGQTKNGVLVESLDDEKRFPVYSTSQISILGDISIYTTDGEEEPLKNILQVMQEKFNGKLTVDAKSGSDELRSFFTDILPNHDTERVYTSDIKKVIKWYSILVEKGYFDQQQESTESSEEEGIIEDAEIIEETKIETKASPKDEAED